MPGGTLRDRLGSPVALLWAARVCSHLAAALDYAHGRGVIHRDLKPNNVLLGEADWPLLCDFGIARIIGGSRSLTGTGVGIGTPAYMSPEQGQGLEVDGATDLYALGVVFFEMLVGHVPYQAETPLAVVLKHINEALPSIWASNQTVPAELDGVLSRALAKRAEERFPSCRAFARAVDEAIATSTAPGVPAGYWYATQATLADAAGSPEPVMTEPRGGEAAPAEPRAGGGDHPSSTPDLVARVLGQAWARARSRWPARGPFMRRHLAATLAGVTAALGLVGVALLARPAEPPPMSGLFNIAVAPFSEIDGQGNAQRWDQGVKVSESIVSRLRDEFEAIPEMKGIVEVRGQNVEPIMGRTSADRQDAAHRLADKLRAQLLIYGVLEKDGTRTVFSPGFYINRLDEAEELLGPNHLGGPVPLSGPAGELSQVFLVSEASRARTEALSLFSVGLTFWAAGRPARAVEYFERAGRVDGWDDKDGKEVLYLFLGTAYRDRNADGDPDRARAAYAAAVGLNPEYARAHLGLGNLHYAEFERSGRVDTTALDRALDDFQRAASSKFRPGTAYVDAKIHLALGNVYVVKAQLGSPELFPMAEEQFRQIVKEFEAGSGGMDRVAAQAFLGLGIVQERWTQDRSQAAAYYRKSIAVSGRDPATRQLAETQLRVVEAPGP